jgi:hypothetical protein
VKSMSAMQFRVQRGHATYSYPVVVTRRPRRREFGAQTGLRRDADVLAAPRQMRWCQGGRFWDRWRRAKEDCCSALIQEDSGSVRTAEKNAPRCLDARYGDPDGSIHRRHGQHHIADAACKRGVGSSPTPVSGKRQREETIATTTPWRLGDRQVASSGWLAQTP